MVVAKAGWIATNICWVMSNIGGPAMGKCNLLANVATLVLLYGTPNGADTINVKAD